MQCHGRALHPCPKARWHSTIEILKSFLASRLAMAKQNRQNQSYHRSTLKFSSSSGSNFDFKLALASNETPVPQRPSRPSLPPQSQNCRKDPTDRGCGTDLMANSLRPYLTCIQNTLTARYVFTEFSLSGGQETQQTQGRIQVLICRNEAEKCLKEASINSLRIKFRIGGYFVERMDCKWFFVQKITEEDLDAFAASYRGSEEEARNLKDEYRRRKGNMNVVFTFIICSNPKLDSHRFMDIIDSAISAGELKEFKVYRRWAVKVSKESAPPNPLALPKRKNGRSEQSSSLLAVISSRGKDRMNSLASTIEAKYGGGKKSRDSKLDHEPSEEEFLAAQKRVTKRLKKKGSKQD